MDYETVYESTSSNRNESNISCSGQYLLYSRSNRPVIWDLSVGEVVTSLVGHLAEVNSQNFVDNLTGDCCQKDILHIISTSHDGSAIIWEVNKKSISDYKIVHRLNCANDNLIATCSCIRVEDNFCTITTTLDGNTHLWKNEELIQTISNPKACFLTSKIYSIELQDGEHLTLLFLSTSDNKVYVYQIQHASSYLLEFLFDLTGYNDWVKSIDALRLANRQNEFLLATACQDSLIKIWHMKLLVDQESDSRRIRTKVSKPLHMSATHESIRLSATLETVLSGHTGFVHGLCWVKKQLDPKTLQLFSCSADKTIVLWQSEVATDLSRPTNDGSQPDKYEQCPASKGIWKEIQRMGETGETNLPFIGICLDEHRDEQQTLFVQSLRGAIHSWKRGNSDEKENKDQWIISDSITGHYDSITDLSWNKSGAYLLSCSLDKTCRLHSLCRVDNKWHELARPQVHGHELNCITSLDFFRFASGAEEKTIRTFGGTQFFLKNYKHLAVIHVDDLEKRGISAEALPAHAQLPALGLSNRGASCPYDMGATGDSVGQDKATNGEAALPASQEGGWNEMSDLVKRLAKIDHLVDLPHEDILLQSTLWWETNKVYGHCNELHAIASDSCGKFLASASKANRADLAKIFVWETDKFRRVATIEHHTLTITRLRFSPNDKYLLSVSRDRTWSLSERTGQLRNAYKFRCGTNKLDAMHERIIWDCCWTYDSEHFLTVSRDKRAVLWSVDKLRGSENVGVEQDGAQATSQTMALSPPPAGQPSAASGASAAYVTSKLFNCPIQAVDTLPPGQEVAFGSPASCRRLSYLFALGFENGTIELYSLGRDISKAHDQDLLNQQQQFQWNQLRSIANFHQSAIRRLAFRPVTVDGVGPTSSQSSAGRSIEKNERNGKPSLLLASGGDDCVLKLTRFVVAS